MRTRKETSPNVPFGTGEVSFSLLFRKIAEQFYPEPVEGLLEAIRDLPLDYARG